VYSLNNWSRWCLTAGPDCSRDFYCKTQVGVQAITHFSWAGASFAVYV